MSRWVKQIKMLTFSKGLSVPNVLRPLSMFLTTIGCSTAYISLGAILYAGAEAESLAAVMLDCQAVMIGPTEIYIFLFEKMPAWMRLVVDEDYIMKPHGE
jgi:hypothetical protein